MSDNVLKAIGIDVDRSKVLQLCNTDGLIAVEGEKTRLMELIGPTNVSFRILRTLTWD